MRTLLSKTAMMVLPLVGLLFGGCSSHERLHHNLRGVHEDFHEHPHTRAEHEQFHEDVGALHEDAHEHDSYRRRY